MASSFILANCQKAPNRGVRATKTGAADPNAKTQDASVACSNDVKNERVKLLAIQTNIQKIAVKNNSVRDKSTLSDSEVSQLKDLNESLNKECKATVSTIENQKVEACLDGSVTTGVSKINTDCDTLTKQVEGLTGVQSSRSKERTPDVIAKEQQEKASSDAVINLDNGSKVTIQSEAVSDALKEPFDTSMQIFVNGAIVQEVSQEQLTSKLKADTNAICFVSSADKDADAAKELKIISTQKLDKSATSARQDYIISLENGDAKYAITCSIDAKKQIGSEFKKAMGSLLTVSAAVAKTDAKAEATDSSKEDKTAETQKTDAAADSKTASAQPTTDAKQDAAAQPAATTEAKKDAPATVAVAPAADTAAADQKPVGESADGKKSVAQVAADLQAKAAAGKVDDSATGKVAQDVASVVNGQVADASKKTEDKATEEKKAGDETKDQSKDNAAATAQANGAKDQSDKAAEQKVDTKATEQKAAAKTQAAAVNPRTAPYEKVLKEKHALNLEWQRSYKEVQETDKYEKSISSMHWIDKDAAIDRYNISLKVNKANADLYAAYTELTNLYTTSGSTDAQIAAATQKVEALKKQKEKIDAEYAQFNQIHSNPKLTK